MLENDFGYGRILCALRPQVRKERIDDFLLQLVTDFSEWTLQASHAQQRA